jgi:acyl-CoA synthetase (AMP-forming)/AMP-acid ligase II
MPETRAELPAGEIGMVEVRGPNVFTGYWRMPEKTAEELKPDGFFITGDLGRFDADGYLHIVGRGKDLVITGGYNVYPKEVEMAIDDLPGVMESAVIGVPHPDLGEVPLAVVVPEAGARLEAEALAAALRTGSRGSSSRGRGRSWRRCRATRWGRCRRTCSGSGSGARSRADVGTGAVCATLRHGLQVQA